MKDKRSTGDGPNIKEIFGTWIAAYDDGDVERVMSLYDKSAVYSAPCYPDQSFDSLAKWFRFDFDRSGARPHWTFTVESMDASGDLAVVVSQWIGYTDFGTRLQAEVHRFRSVDVFRLGANGWKVVRTVNGPDVCCPAPAKAKKKKKKK